MTTSVAEAIASWVAELRYEELPPEVVSKAKQILLDTAGCALGALEETPVRLARQVVREQGGTPQAFPIGQSWKTSCEQAAFLNGMALRYLDFNDYASPGRPHHPSINVAPALAVAQAQGLSGKELLLGIVVGYEVQLRLRDATANGKHEGWDHSSSVHYSAAALAGKLLGLPPSKIAHAIAIAGSHASTLAEVRGGKLSMWKGAAEPIGARSGTFAALLARAGLTGPLTILEGKHGYGKVVAGALDEEVLRKRGNGFQILKSCTKAWPCVFVAQAPIAAALQLRNQGVLSEQVEEIVVGLSEFGYKNQERFSKEKISTRENADHSVPYCVARAILYGEVRWEDFEEEGFKDPRAEEVMKKIVLSHDPKLAAFLPEIVGANLEVKLRSGKLLRAEVPYPPGHSRNPLSDGEVVKKFLSLAKNIMSEEQANKAVEVILNAEQLTNLDRLADVLCPGPSIEQKP
ncbi:MAG: MmgE/PrpD family protein [Deltaproteobacteria bacterium]|nr:MmgE/PrpD family protein [Deltaproteobacteria bacterium]